MPRIHIIYHSTKGHTERLAECVAEGAQGVSGGFHRLIRVHEAQEEHITRCEGLILGCPTYMGNVSAQMKIFMDEVLSPIWMKGGIPGTVGSAFTSSSTIHGDQEFAIMAMLITMFQMGMTLISLPPMVIRENKSYGYSRGVGTSTLGMHASMMPREDCELARHLGKRVAEVAKQIHGI